MSTVTFKYNINQPVNVQGIRAENGDLERMYVICQIRSDKGNFYLLRRPDASKLHVAESEMKG